MVNVKYNYFRLHALYVRQMCQSEGVVKCKVLWRWQMAGQLKSIQQRLNVTESRQKYHRRREARGRASAESLNERVMYWSASQSIVLVVVAAVQVAIVRSFFADKRQPPWYLVGLGLTGRLAV